MGPASAKPNHRCAWHKARGGRAGQELLLQEQRKVDQMFVMQYLVPQK